MVSLSCGLSVHLHGDSHLMIYAFPALLDSSSYKTGWKLNSRTKFSKTPKRSL